MYNFETESCVPLVHCLETVLVCCILHVAHDTRHSVPVVLSTNQ